MENIHVRGAHTRYSDSFLVVLEEIHRSACSFMFLLSDNFPWWLEWLKPRLKRLNLSQQWGRWTWATAFHSNKTPSSFASFISFSLCPFFWASNRMFISEHSTDGSNRRLLVFGHPFFCVFWTNCSNNVQISKKTEFAKASNQRENNGRFKTVTSFLHAMHPERRSPPFCADICASYMFSTHVHGLHHHLLLN